MTSPLVNPFAGYITLSRLDSSSCLPSMCTRIRSAGRSGIACLLRGLVRTQSDVPRKTQPPVASEIAVPDLDHGLRPYPDRAARVLARHRSGERGFRRA